MALKEYEHLVRTGRFSSQFSTGYSTVDFSNALYPPGPHLYRDHCPPFPRAAQPVIDEQCVVEETPQSANGERNYGDCCGFNMTGGRGSGREREMREWGEGGRERERERGRI